MRNLGRNLTHHRNFDCDVNSGFAVLAEKRKNCLRGLNLNRSHRPTVVRFCSALWRLLFRRRVGVVTGKRCTVMEDSRIFSMKFLRPHRRSPFKSQTNQVLAQIFSLYGDQIHSGRLVKFVPYKHSLGKASISFVQYSR